MLKKNTVLLNTDNKGRWSDRLIGDLQCCNCNSQDAFFSVKVDHKN